MSTASAPIDFVQLFQENQIVILIALVAGPILIAILFLASQGPKKALDKDSWRPLELVEKETLSHDVRRFRFKLPEGTILGLPVGQHISFKYVDNENKDIIRSYTPTKEGNGYVDFVLKIYYPAPPKFPVGGKMSQFVENLKIGETLLMKGPKGHLDYKGQGKVSIFRKPKIESLYQVRKIGMIAGGTCSPKCSHHGHYANITVNRHWHHSLLADHSRSSRRSS